MNIWPISDYLERVRRKERQRTLNQLSSELISLTHKMGFRDPLVDRTIISLADQIRESAEKIQ